MSYITYSGITGYCPHIEDDVQITGKYQLIDEHSAKLVSFTCPIEENSKLPTYEQCEKYKYMISCKKVVECPIAKNLKRQINL